MLLVMAVTLNLAHPWERWLMFGGSLGLFLLIYSVPT
jgi:hypothetical protein